MFGSNYEDGKIEVVAEETAGDNPVMQKHFENLEFDSEDGVLTIEGEVKSEKVKKRVYEMVEEKLKKTRVDFEEVVDEMEVSDS